MRRELAKWFYKSVAFSSPVRLVSKSADGSTGYFVYVFLIAVSVISIFPDVHANSQQVTPPPLQ
jgi:hypothetical protein